MEMEFLRGLNKALVRVLTAVRRVERALRTRKRRAAASWTVVANRTESANNTVRRCRRGRVTTAIVRRIARPGGILKTVDLAEHAGRARRALVLSLQTSSVAERPCRARILRCMVRAVHTVVPGRDVQQHYSSGD